MKPNPYAPPERAVSASRSVPEPERSRDASAAPLYWLLGIGALTLLLAWIDAVQEGVPGVVFTAQVTIGAVVAQIPGFLCGELYRRTNGRQAFMFLVPAFGVAIISLLIYILYVLAGRVQTVNNAAQMHVILIPILLAMLAFVAYFVTGVIWATIKLTQRNA